MADDYVFEPCAGDDRPRVKCNVNLIQEIDSFNGLTQQARPDGRSSSSSSVPFVWQEAGRDWGRPSGLANDRRPLQYDSGICFEGVQHVTAHQLSQRATEFCRAAGWSKGTREELKEFVRLVQQHFSNPSAFLKPKSLQQVLRDMSYKCTYTIHIITHELLS